MTKKEYIIKLLTALINDWGIAKPLLTLIERNVLDKEVINALTEIFKKAVKETTNKIKQVKLNKGLAFLKKIEKQELEENSQKLEENSNKKKIEEILNSI